MKLKHDIYEDKLFHHFSLNFPHKEDDICNIPRKIQQKQILQKIFANVAVK